MTTIIRVDEDNLSELPLVMGGYLKILTEELIPLKEICDKVANWQWEASENGYHEGEYEEVFSHFTNHISDITDVSIEEIASIAKWVSKRCEEVKVLTIYNTLKEEEATECDGSDCNCPSYGNYTGDPHDYNSYVKACEMLAG